MLKGGPLVALVLIGAGALVFDLTLPLRLPSEADWAEAAGVLRAKKQDGDAVQLWPAWAERARLFVDAMPVLAEEDLAQADFAGVRRLWVLSLPRAPFASRPDAALRSRGATPISDPEKFGALALQAWDLHAAAVESDLTRATEDHEVDYVARRCLRVQIGARFSARGSGNALHVRAGVIGERAYEADRPSIQLQIFSGGELLRALEIPRTERDGTGWRRADLPLPGGERGFVFAVSSPDASRPFCLQAWTTQ